MAIEIKRWKCSHCKKHFSDKRYAEKHHETRCFFNPELKTCPTCIYFNGDFNPRGCKCNFTGRENKIIKREMCGIIIDGYEFNVFTEFLVYNCEHWENAYEDTKEDDDV